jgi:hypothetical protein
MSQWIAENLRRPFRPLASVALLALAPKCMVCVLAYAGIGAIFGLQGPEICGAAASSRGLWASPPAQFGFALGIVGLIARLWWRRSANRDTGNGRSLES